MLAQGIHATVRWGLVRRAARLWRPAVFLAAALAIWLFGRAWWTVRAFEPERPPRSAAIYDVKGRLIGTVGAAHVVYVPLDQIAPSLVHAIVATEDARFFRHLGLDPIGIVRALLADLRARRIVQGASTITQQLARTLFLTTERTLVRKLDEAALAIMLELRFPKERILELYLNRVYFGEGAAGIASAAMTYFGKAPSRLTLGESALLAGVVRTPSSLSPYRDMEAALKRRQVVLQRMVDVGYISPAEARAAAEEPVRLAGIRGGVAPWFIDYIRPLLVDRFGFNLVHRGSLRVHTSFDLDMQEAAIRALGDRQGAIVAIDPRTGDIKAMVGGRDYLESQFNRATSARRQPGSAFKPFVYAAALEQGWRPNSIVEDIPRDFDGYSPHNYGDRYWGPVTLKHALVMSLNVGSVWLASAVGIDRALNLASQLGVTTLTPEDRNLAATLGGLRLGVTPLQMAQAFQAFANGGILYPVRAFTRVVDEDGYVWFAQPSPSGRRVLSPQVAYLMTNMLSDALNRGTGQAAHLSRPAAGKTGTTDSLVSAWFVGYTPDLVAAVYVGNDRGDPVRGTGGALAAPIWKSFMEQALGSSPAKDFPVPDGIVTGIDVDIFSGRRAAGLCKWVERDAFIAGTEPTGWSACVIGIQPEGQGARHPEPFAGSEAPLRPSPGTEEAPAGPPEASGMGEPERLDVGEAGIAIPVAPETE